MSSKITLYKTAYSPLYQQYVEIQRVRFDNFDIAIFECRVGDSIVIFREHELTNFNL